MKYQVLIIFHSYHIEKKNKFGIKLNEKITEKKLRVLWKSLLYQKPIVKLLYLLFIQTLAFLVY